MAAHTLSSRISAALVGLGLLTMLVGSAFGGQGRYLDKHDYLRSAFGNREAAAATLWVDESIRSQIEAIVGHPFDALRVRYWQLDGRTAWVLDEIGKELPITIGVTVSDGAVDAVRVLEFRESRGWEVRHPFFTDQYSGVRSLPGDRRLDRPIDGITGATLSVAAVSRAVKLALFLSKQIKLDGQ